MSNGKWKPEDNEDQILTLMKTKSKTLKTKRNKIEKKEKLSKNQKTKGNITEKQRS